MLINFIPLFVRLETKADRSPVIPPPKDIIQSDSQHVFDIQISNYPDSNQSYLVFSSATKDPFKTNQYRSVTVGLLINQQLKRKIAFLDDKKIKHFDVGVTCERCAIKDCNERMVPAKILEKEQKNLKIETVVNDIFKQFS